MGIVLAALFDLLYGKLFFSLISFAFVCCRETAVRV
jgi:hypothetical protein